MLKVQEFLSVEPLLVLPSERERLREAVYARAVCIVRRALDPRLVAQIIDYLAGVGRGSIPNRHATAPGCPNHHRVYQWDERSYVKGCFHQFSFFPWNEDVFNFFKVFRPTYELRNLLNDLPAAAFLGNEPEMGCTARISFQFYPSGAGAMNKHSDPVDIHQKVVPLLMMSRRGVAYRSGGLYFEDDDGTRLYPEDHTDPGDLVCTFAQVAHGVETIDENAEVDWLSFRGRWSAIVAVNKLVSNTNIGDPVDLELKSAPANA